MLADRARALGGSQTSGMRNRARKLQAEGIRVVNFAAGELDQDTSPTIKEAARQAIEAGRTQYTDTLGIRELREGLARKVSEQTGSDYSAEEVGFTSGAKQALFNSVFVSFQGGDEVIIPAPYWVTFPEQVRLAGATPVFLPTASHGFQIDLDELARLITPKTRGLLLNTPHNPTGVVYGSDVLEGIARLAIQHDLLCIFDECYDQLVYRPAVHHRETCPSAEGEDRPDRLVLEDVLHGRLEGGVCRGTEAGHQGHRQSSKSYRIKREQPRAIRCPGSPRSGQ